MLMLTNTAPLPKPTIKTYSVNLASRKYSNGRTEKQKLNEINIKFIERISYLAEKKCFPETNMSKLNGD